ncbi:hypothetical protein AVEN_19024-1 [Araneus ventricosus]|uniref:Uncharacterized protein n=1 Tax=Araneus ventricosus TaxID=182803 RepID=A0A4Y2KID8_ARAVE|nr:hypothetical protein AVEN_19024-1 [Araneus ventricosus]
MKHIEGKTFEIEQKRRAEEVKHCEQNKRFVHERSKSFEKCNTANGMDIDNADKSRRNSESRVDKYPNRNNRRRDSNIGDRSLSQHTKFPFFKKVSTERTSPLSKTTDRVLPTEVPTNSSYSFKSKWSCTFHALTC